MTYRSYTFNELAYTFPLLENLRYNDVNKGMNSLLNFISGVLVQDKTKENVMFYRFDHLFSTGGISVTSLIFVFKRTFDYDEPKTYNVEINMDKTNKQSQVRSGQSAPENTFRNQL